jgi:hypothetical protein
MKLFSFLSALSFSTVLFGQLNGPESIDFDATNNRYLIANKNNGKILQRAANGTITDFVTNISPNPYGLEVVGNVVYACCSGQVKGFDLTTGAEVFNVNVGGTFLNGITHDNNGNLYVTDFTAKVIYRINIATQQFYPFASSLVNSPNGIIFDQPSNSLVFVSWGTSAKIKRCLLSDSSVTTLVTTAYNNIDGIARNAAGDFFISVWSNNSVFKYNNDFTTVPQLIINGLSSPADIYYNTATDTLAIPNSGNNTITFVGFSTAGIEESLTSEISVYPNPFLDLIHVSSFKQEISSYEILDLNGRVVIANTPKNSVTDEIDLSLIEAGSYVIRFYNDGNILSTKRIEKVK